MHITATLTLRVYNPGGVHAAQFEQLHREGDIKLASRTCPSYTGGEGASCPDLERRAVDGQFLGDEKSAVGGAESTDEGPLPHPPRQTPADASEEPW
jgi:hypothetical protein